MSTKRAIWVRLAVILTLGLGLSYFLYGEQLILMQVALIRNPRLAAMPVTPLREVAKFAGTGKLVRVKADMFVEPPITTSTHQALSFKSVRITHEEGKSHVVYRDDEYWKPVRFSVRDGSIKVRIDTEAKAPDYRYLPVLARGVLRKGALPADVADAIAPDFKTMHRHEGHTVTVHGIPEDAPVTIIGVVELRDGRPVLLHPRERSLGIDTGRLIVSPFPDSELDAKLRSEAWVVKVTIALVLATSIATALLIVFLGRREKRRAAAEGPPTG